MKIQLNDFLGTNTIVFLLLTAYVQAQADVFYCLRDEAVSVITNETGIIKTLYDGQTVYDNNQKCTWIIDAGQGENRGISLKITKSHLEWAPEKTTCLEYDNIQIFDGETEESDSIVKWCGEQNPHSVSSSGRYLRIVFSSNEKNIYEYGGAVIEFTVFGQLGGCQPGWVDFPDRPAGGDSCLMVKSHKESWMDAQRYCNYDQANLVKTPTYADADLLNGVLQSMASVSSTENIWLGLNDIEVDTEYRWMDSELLNMSPSRWRTNPHESDPYDNCVTTKTVDGLWAEDFCNENNIQTLVKYKFVCEKKKVGPTVLYKVPNERKNKPGKSTGIPVLVWAAPVAVVCLVIIIIIGVVVYKKIKSSNVSKRNEQENRSNQNLSQSLQQRGTQVQPRRPPYTEQRRPLEEISLSPDSVNLERRPSPPPSYDTAIGTTSAVCKS